MNRILLTLIILIPISLFSQEYEYVPFPDSGAIWSEVYQPPINSDLTWLEPIYERFALNGEDTVINDTVYKKLYIFYDTTFNKNTATYIGGIREDENKRVYYKGDTIIHDFKPMVDFHNYEEILLFDFSVSIGDTIWEGNYPEGVFQIVSNIDTIQIEGGWRRRIHFQNYYWVKWIEGIGSTKGLLFTSGDLPTNGLDNNLICLIQGNEIKYFNNNYNDCIPIITGIETYQNNNSAINVYPNPVVNNCLTFQFGNCLVSNLKIFDCKGNSLGMYEVGGQAEYILKTEKYQPGVYFYIATNKQGIGHTGKFVVQ
ncbi:MAG: T9SS type A sorting domain-containing protein [Marinilabiliaceae bacterium]|nr:T9SS type A sorting domain-containing protein [Marinilabiliaceae bacterium]